ncbi:AAA family ATPase [Vibrio splendidus]|uniref:AAA family ATPase n=1 Tax=Vibrio splendidus TaxID=29497 RepID=A0AB35N550_VIBSP|nr:AAA family ATPase [Vibrio splendidus]MDP2503693.1 AAA family ATPase [Vibrio splendidus]
MEPPEVKIDKLILTNFRAFKNFELELDPKLTVLIARNGAGKSSILDAISTNLGSFLTRLPGVSGHNPKDSDFRITEQGDKPAYMRIYCQATNGVEWDRTERRDKSKKTQKEIPEGVGLKTLNTYVDTFIDAHNDRVSYQLPVFIYYGTGRGVFDVPQRKTGFSKKFPRFEALAGALESRTNFKRFVEYFYFLEDQESRLQKEHRSFDIEVPELKTIRSAVNRMMPEFKNPRTAAPAGLMVDWKNNETMKQLRIEQLSDGYRTTLAMVMDIAARMAEANPFMDDPLDTTGMILIDEVDLHLHPEWQRDFLPKLVDTFPKIQFVVTTHSPFIIQSLSKGKLVDLDEEEPGGSSAYFTRELSVEDIAEEIMGVQDVQRSARYNERMKLADEYYRLLDEGYSSESPEVESIAARLDEIEELFGDNPAEVALLKSERRTKKES